MTIFAVIAQPGTNAERLPSAIQSEFPNDSLSISQDVWMIAWRGTPQELSEKLGVTDGSNGSAIVVSIGTYYGRAVPSIWEWIKTKWEATGG